MMLPKFDYSSFNRFHVEITCFDPKGRVNYNTGENVISDRNISFVEMLKFCKKCIKEIRYLKQRHDELGMYNCTCPACVAKGKKIGSKHE